MVFVREREGGGERESAFGWRAIVDPLRLFDRSQFSPCEMFIREMSH